MERRSGETRDLGERDRERLRYDGTRDERMEILSERKKEKRKDGGLDEQMNGETFHMMGRETEGQRGPEYEQSDKNTIRENNKTTKGRSAY